MDPKGTLKRLLPKRTQKWLLQLPRRVVDATERARRLPWPTDVLIDEEPRRVSLVTVNYNTLGDTAHLLFSIFRVLELGSIESVIVWTTVPLTDRRSSSQRSADAGSFGWYETAVSRVTVRASIGA